MTGCAHVSFANAGVSHLTGVRAAHLSGQGTGAVGSKSWCYPQSHEAEHSALTSWRPGAHRVSDGRIVARDSYESRYVRLLSRSRAMRSANDPAVRLARLHLARCGLICRTRAPFLRRSSMGATPRVTLIGLPTQGSCDIDEHWHGEMRCHQMPTAQICMREHCRAALPLCALFASDLWRKETGLLV